MSITFQKRQKELKRQEKQRAKAERREQRKIAKRAERRNARRQPRRRSPNISFNLTTNSRSLPNNARALSDVRSRGEV